MRCTVDWQKGVAFSATTASGHRITMDGAPEAGGKNLGARPMELLLAGAGGCTAFDVMTILTKSRQTVTDCRVELDAERAATDPKVFTRIHMHFVVTGKAVKPEVVERAIRLSKEKYCSASIMLGKTATISADYEIVETGA